MHPVDLQSKTLEDQQQNKVTYMNNKYTWNGQKIKQFNYTAYSPMVEAQKSRKND